MKSLSGSKGVTTVSIETEMLQYCRDNKIKLSPLLEAAIRKIMSPEARARKIDLELIQLQSQVSELKKEKALLGMQELAVDMYSTESLAVEEITAKKEDELARMEALKEEFLQLDRELTNAVIYGLKPIKEKTSAEKYLLMTVQELELAFKDSGRAKTVLAVWEAHLRDKRIITRTEED